MSSEYRIKGWRPPKNQSYVEVTNSVARSLQNPTFHISAPCSTASAPRSAPGSPASPISSTSALSDGKGHDPSWVARPRNCFILFRCWYSRQHGGNGKRVRYPPGTRAMEKTLSKKAAEAWRDLSEEEREYWKNRASEEKVEHARLHPEYIYRPKRQPKNRKGSFIRSHPHTRKLVAHQVSSAVRSKLQSRSSSLDCHSDASLSPQTPPDQVLSDNGKGSPATIEKKLAVITSSAVSDQVSADWKRVPSPCHNKSIDVDSHKPALPSVPTSVAPTLLRSASYSLINWNGELPNESSSSSGGSIPISPLDNLMPSQTTGNTNVPGIPTARTDQVWQPDMRYLPHTADPQGLYGQAAELFDIRGYFESSEADAVLMDNMYSIR